VSQRVVASHASAASHPVAASPLGLSREPAVNRGRAAVLIAGTVAGGAVLAQILMTYASRPAPPLFDVITTAAIGLSFLMAGIAAWRRWPGSRLGLLFSVTGYAWLLPSLSHLPYALPFTIGILTANIYAASLAHLALAWPSGRLRSRFEYGVVIAVYAWNIGQAFISMLFWNPRTEGCGPGCPANLLLAHASNATENAFDLASIPVGLALSATVLTLIVRHWRAATGWSRRAMTPLLWLSFAVIALSVTQTVAANLNVLNDDLLLWGVAPLVLLAGPAVFVISTVRARTARGAVGTAIVDLEPGAPPAMLRDALARALGDSTLQLAFRAGESGYQDTAGQPVDPGQLNLARTVTPLSEAAHAILIHDRGLEHEPQLVRLTAAAASLALEHSRLQAEVQAQLEQVRASRARIVEAGDAERRRLERDLHDGAQQRLVTLTLALGMARSRVAGADPELRSLIESATKEAREALLELRELARGIHPAVLTETGLAGAIQALAERSPVATAISAVPPGRFPAAIEATAYFVVSEALANVAKHSLAGRAVVTIREAAGQLVVEVSDDGAGGARPERGTGLRGLADRVASVGGELRIESPPGAGTRLEADIPCA
jgi:signal transduction histidine kinase